MEKANDDIGLKSPPKETVKVPSIAKEPNAQKPKKRPSSENVKADQTIALPSWFDLEDLEQRVLSMMEKAKTTLECSHFTFAKCVERKHEWEI